MELPDQYVIRKGELYCETCQRTITPNREYRLVEFIREAEEHHRAMH